MCVVVNQVINIKPIDSEVPDTIRVLPVVLPKTHSTRPKTDATCALEDETRLATLESQMGDVTFAIQLLNGNVDSLVSHFRSPGARVCPPMPQLGYHLR